MHDTDFVNNILQLTNIIADTKNSTNTLYFLIFYSKEDNLQKQKKSRKIFEIFLKSTIF